MTKQEKFDIIQKTNPARDDIHVHIRSVEEVKTLAEALEQEPPVYPDNENIIYTKKIMIYSSKKIKAGTFVSTSEIMAGEYAGIAWESRDWYSQKRYNLINRRKVDEDEVAWINGDEGIYVGK